MASTLSAVFTNKLNLIFFLCVQDFKIPRSIPPPPQKKKKNIVVCLICNINGAKVQPSQGVLASGDFVVDSHFVVAIC